MDRARVAMGGRPCVGGRVADRRAVPETTDVAPSLFKYRSRQGKVADVANAWRRQYGDSPADSRKAEILERLDALDPATTTPAEIDSTIGNSSWTSETCGVCENDSGEWWFEFQTWGDPQIMCCNCALKLRIVLEAVQ